MSRIGKLPIKIPSGVSVRMEGNVFYCKSSKGELSVKVHELATIEIDEQEIRVLRRDESRQSRSIHGLTRTLLANAVDGVSKGFEKRLEINGVGYRAAIQGNKLVLSLGYSHPIEYPQPKGIEFKMDEQKKNVIIVSGIDKQQVGQVSSEIRGFRKPEPYKGKGIRYEGEYIARKAGKTASKGS